MQFDVQDCNLVFFYLFIFAGLHSTNSFGKKSIGTWRHTSESKLGGYIIEYLAVLCQSDGTNPGCCMRSPNQATGQPTIIGTINK